MYYVFSIKIMLRIFHSHKFKLRYYNRTESAELSLIGTTHLQILIIFVHVPERATFQLLLPPQRGGVCN